MNEIKKVLDDLLASLAASTENEDWDSVNDLCDEFSYVVFANKAKFIHYFSNIHRADYEKMINIFMALDPFDWHDFLIEQLKKYLEEAQQTTPCDSITEELLDVLADFSDTVEEEELLSRDIQKELLEHLESDNIPFRNLCFKLIAKASSHKSDITLNRLERLKQHDDWRIRVKAYQTKNKIMQWRKNRGLPLSLRLRKMLPW